jgi:hypothetical protein
MIEKERFVSIKWDYLLVFLLIANSGIPFFYLYIEFKILNLIIVGIIFLFRNKIIDKYIFYYLTLFILISIGQYYVFRTSVLNDSLSVIIRILIAYLTIKTVMIRIFPITRDLIYIFAILSFFLLFTGNNNPLF